MLRPLRRVHHSSLWYKTLQTFFADIAVLGFELDYRDGEAILHAGNIQADPAVESRQAWSEIHLFCHLKELVPSLDWIRSFEAAHSDLFISGRSLNPDSIRPVVELVDFSDKRHLRITQYLQKFQTKESKKLVGRRLGALVFDEGQSCVKRPLIGGLMLSSPRYFQPNRDRYLGWPRRGLDPENIRLKGLDRMMHLSTVCAIPPYSFLGASWFLAAIPFTSCIQEEFKRVAWRSTAQDLIAVTSISSMGRTGTPFQRHSVSKLVDPKFAADEGMVGSLYRRIKVGECPKAKFVNLLGNETLSLLCRLHKREQPEFVRAIEGQVFKEAAARKGTTARIVTSTESVLEERKIEAALTFFLKGIGQSRRIFEGNEMGVHIGTLGDGGIAALSSGEHRSRSPAICFEKLRESWANRYSLDPVHDRSTSAIDKILQSKAAKKRRANARRTRLKDVYLSQRVPSG